MATRELQTILNSGEITNIYLNGTAADNKVLESSVITELTDALDARLDELESSHSVLLSATSLASSQEPSNVDTALQIEFGAAQSTADIDISVAGEITFKTAGKYIISPFFQYGRSTSSSTSILLNRYLVNGTQIGASLAAKIDNANILVPWSSSVQLTVSENDVLTIELIRDSAGNNSGGLFALNPTLAGWADAPCASIQIYKAV